MKLLVVDGNSILNRAYYGIRPLTTKDGQFTHAIYGFLTMLQKIKADVSPDHAAIAFDLREKTFRHKAYSGYKAQRKGMPPELASQLEPLKDLLAALGYKIVTCPGYEADDILGTLALACEKQSGECVIATGDRDSLQLVSEHTTVRLAATKHGAPTAVLYGRDEIFEAYGVEPKALIEIKAIQGDASDNIPGVAGIGPKGAGDLIKKYNTVSYIYEHIDELDIKDSVRQKLINSRDNAMLSRMLGEICTSAPIDCDMQSYIIGEGDPELAQSIMTKLELFSLMEKMGFNSNPSAAEIRQAQNVKSVSVGGSADFNADRLFLLSVTDGRSISGCYVFSENRRESVGFVADEDGINRLLLSDAQKIVYNSKPIFAYADLHNIKAVNISFDVTLAAYLLNPSASDYTLNRLCSEYCVPEIQCDDENAALCAKLLPLYEKLYKKLEECGQLKLLKEIEIPLAGVLAEMENSGFAVDRDGIVRYGEMTDEKISELQKEIYSDAGYEFNINSPKQLGAALFEKMQLPAKKKTKSGYSTSADVLDELRGTYPIVDKVLSFRTYSKLKSTYCDGLVKVIADDGRIHSSFNQTETRTGRISSTEPNLQNIPVRTELGREMRRFFCAGDGMLLIDADYSQIELRVLAHLSDDENMKQAFLTDSDIHTITASQVFSLPPEMITPALRSRAKAVNFGIVYGIGAFSLAKDIGVTNREAAEYIRAYLAHYSGVNRYMEEMIEKATQYGYAETMFGRRRYLPELTASNKITKAFGQRVARNMPIQGTAADIIKIAMIKVCARLKEENLRSRLILQVHDELIVESPENEAEKVCKILQEEMEKAVTLSVPLVAQAHIGKTWYDAKG